MIDELSWLGGIWDGEGTIGIYKRSTYFIPSTSVCNTDERIINKVKEILDMYGLSYRVEYNDRGETKNSKPAWAIKMEGKQRAKAFLTLIKPYLVAKHEQASIVLSWCSLEGRRRTLKQEDYALISEVKALNHRGRVR